MYPILRRSRGLAAAALACAVCGGAFAAVAGAQPAVNTNRGCYVVGQTVQLSGRGFSPSRTYIVTVDGVFFGNRTTDSQGGLAVAVHPGGLPAGTAQHVDRVSVFDGTTFARANFTVTRPAGALIQTTGSTPSTVQARFRVWGYSLTGVTRPVYVHYVDPAGHQRAHKQLGQTAGACGTITTPRRTLFPFSVSPGKWILQVDTQKAYARHPTGPVTRIQVSIA